MRRGPWIGLLAVLSLAACSTRQQADVVIRGGTVYDGTPSAGRVADIVIQGDRIADVGDASGWQGMTEIDAAGKAVTPGFINMLSWATDSLIEDGRSQADIRQGVTLEVFDLEDRHALTLARLEIADAGDDRAERNLAGSAHLRQVRRRGVGELGQLTAVALQRMARDIETERFFFRGENLALVPAPVT